MTKEFREVFFCNHSLKDYRAIVVHSSAHDKRRHKRLDRQLEKNRKAMADICKKTCTPFFCEADALSAAREIEGAAEKSGYHRILTTIEEVPRYKRGRPAKDQQREVERYEYFIKTKIVENAGKVAQLRAEAGCFVLLTNLISEQQRQEWDACRVLMLYKNQSGIEQNFGFLKDPAIVNGIFLKKASRIEVLGLILLIALLIWRLMERAMRNYTQVDDQSLPGWEKRSTKRPTSFMMTTKFSHVFIVTVGKERYFGNPLSPIQKEYLRALDINPNAFITP